ncbi:acyl-CoA thioesterase [Insolitispirillum peregrinum]|uniref:acyl-CoA thioesterase n=1 Tax=Insolitispirillum peregrinum TaxID=80876 RepID=UPI00360D0F85
MSETVHPLSGSTPAGPTGEVSIRTIAMPADTNPSGDVFGGWLMSQMDLAGGTFARYCAGGRVATVAVDGFTFHKPVFVGDELTCYCHEVRRGRTSLAIAVEAWVRRMDSNVHEKVTEGLFTFVAIDDNRHKRVIGTGA